MNSKEGMVLGYSAARTYAVGFRIGFVFCYNSLRNEWITVDRGDLFRMKDNQMVANPKHYLPFTYQGGS